MDYQKLFDNSGKIVHITGGGGTLGTAICIGLAAVGAKIAAADCSIDS